MKNRAIFDRKFKELTGCIHNHTEYSFDSKVKVQKIVREAEKAGLDYLTINDHMVKEAQKDIPAKSELITIIGTEIHDKKRNNHLLVFGNDEIKENQEAADYLNYYMQNDAICFAAHPIDKRASRLFRKYPWTDKKLDKFHGLEIWNYLSTWVGRLKPPWNGLWHVLFPNWYVKRPDRNSLNYWDELNRKHNKKVAIGSIDAHTETWNKYGLKISFLTHRQLFKTIRTNVLIPDGEDLCENSILKALKEGNSYIVNYRRGIPYNFYAGISTESGVGAIFGEKIKLKQNMNFFFNLPANARVILFKNGEKIASQYNEKGRFAIDEPGFYRLEIYRFALGWIYTNNIYVIK